MPRLWLSRALDLLSFNLFLVAQICVDLATHLISDEGWEPTATAREAYERLEKHGVISKETVRALRRAVGLRNFVAHGHGGNNPARIHASARTGLPDLESFAAELSAWLKQAGVGEG
jgi:uncharacterized protein YutE (UPF0331/DUF86 family)